MTKESEHRHDELVRQIRDEIGRWQNEPAPEKPTYLMCLEDIRFERLFLQQLCDLHKLLKFVSPLVGKTVKINGFKFDHVSSGFRTELDYEIIEEEV